MAKKATLHELQTVYTLDDVVYLNEVEDLEIEMRPKQPEGTQ